MRNSILSAPVRLLAWLGGRELALLLALGGIAAGAWGFAALAGEVMEGDTQSMDRHLLLAMRHPGDLTPIGPPLMQEAARDITSIGGVALLTLVTAIVAGYLVLDGKTRLAMFACASVVSGQIVAVILKDLFHRARPDLVPHAVYVATTSFPSGHSMMSAVTYLTLGALLARAEERKRLKAYFVLVAALLSLMVGVTRVYLGVHWPTDVLAGWVAGSVWALLCWLVARSLQKHHALELEAEHESAGSFSTSS